MTNPKDIMPAIDLLMKSKRNNRLPRWFVVLDYVVAGAYLLAFGSAIAFLTYKLVSWL